MTSHRAEETLLALLAQRVERRAGLLPPLWLLRARCEARAAALDRPLPAYLAGLSADGDGELDRLVEALRVGETRFFRHPGQLAALQTEHLPAALARSRAEGRPLRLWSAGCATGEEAWTLAMLAADAVQGDGPVPEVLGTDLSAAALETAQAGVYPAAAAAQVPAPLLARYLEVLTDGRVAVAPTLRQAVSVRFRRHNLLSTRYPGPFDLILCRNVLIYFEDDRRREVLDRLRRSLAPGGELLLGPSEESAPPGGRESPSPRAGAGAAATPAPGAGAGLLRLRGSYGDGERLQRELWPYLLAPQPLTIDLDGAEFLGQGDARVLRRAAELLPIQLTSRKPAVLRWLRRQGLRAREGAP